MMATFSPEDFARLGMQHHDAGEFRLGGRVYNLTVSNARTSRVDSRGRPVWIKVRTVTRSDALVPELAVDEDGKLYTGPLTGAIEPNFDWRGSFFEGRPHGAFDSTWMGFRPGPEWLFEHGVSLPLPDGERPG